MKDFEKLSTFVDLFHYLYYKTREGRKLDVPQLLGFIQPNLREEFTYYFQVSKEDNLQSNNASKLNTAGA
jgi:hypothetical protein